jgi:hypothetical protein
MPGVDEAPTAESPSAPTEDAPAQAAEPSAPHAQEWPLEDQPTLNLTGRDLDVLTREDTPKAVEDAPTVVEGVESESEGETEGEGELEVEDEAAGVEEATDISRAHLRGLLEALIFASD